MPLIVKETGGSDIEPIPEGVYTAVCYSVVDIGTHYSEKYDKASRRVIITWEIPELRIQVERDGQKQDLPRAISKRYTLSLHTKSVLRNDLCSWRGRAFSPEELAGFDLQNVLGSACQIQVLHEHKDDKTYANIGSIMRLPKGAMPPKPENPLLFFSLSDLLEQVKGGAGVSIPSAIPEWQVRLIQESKEYEKLTKPLAKQQTSRPAAEAPKQTIEDDDVPF